MCEYSQSFEDGGVHWQPLAPNLAVLFDSVMVCQHLSRFYIKSQLCSHLIRRCGHIGPAFFQSNRGKDASLDKACVLDP